MIKVEFMDEEAKVVEEYLFRKVCRLEESGLSDSYCYPKLYEARRKLSNAIAAHKGDD